MSTSKAGVKNDAILDLNKKYTYTSWAAQADVNPIVVEKAEGVYFWDYKGKKYIDFSSQLVLTNIGHGDKRVQDAIVEQMQKFNFIYPGLASEVRGKLGKKLAEITPGDLCKTFFTLGGAEANENAIKIARQFTGKKKIFTRLRSYHGSTLATATAGGDPRRHPMDVEAPWICRMDDPDWYRGPLYQKMSQEKADLLLLDMLEQRIELEDPNTCAAIMLEGHSGSSGGIAPTKAYWQRIRKICDKFNMLLIVDEVMSGFGRTGKWFGVDHYDVVPDIMTMAKGLTSGYLPLGAVITNKKVAAFFDKTPLNSGLTYSAHPTSVAAALATIKVYQDDKLIERAVRTGKYLEKKLKELESWHEMVGNVRGKGMLWVMDLVKNKKTKEELSPWNRPQTPKMKKIVADLRKAGFSTLIRWNWIIIAPPLTITKEELDEGIEILDKVLTKNA